MKKILLNNVCIISIAVIFSCTEKSTQTSEPFEGITETSSIGPDPIGNIDTDDWRPLMDCSSNPKIDHAILLQSSKGDTVIQVQVPYCTKIFPAYPNPANKSFSINFSINETDSVVVTLNSTPTTIVNVLFQRRASAGMYSIIIDGKELQPALYRIYITVFRQADVLHSYGDVQIVN
jgi:hypothetical protein